ncbi:hypothetical protein AAG570_010124, partial [Ranatra chinensis]
PAVGGVVLGSVRWSDSVLLGGDVLGVVLRAPSLRWGREGRLALGPPVALRCGGGGAPDSATALPPLRSPRLPGDHQAGRQEPLRLHRPPAGHLAAPLPHPSSVISTAL